MHKSIYSPGSEYLLCQAQVQIMSAVVGVLTESVTESLRGFYKLRKAFLTLEAISQEEKKYLESLEAGGKPIHLPAEPSDTSEDPSTVVSEEASIAETSSQQMKLANSQAETFYDPPETRSELEDMKTPPAEETISNALDNIDLQQADTEKPEILRRLSSKIEDGPDLGIFGDNHIDSYIHSSTSMCYGILLLMISMLPPAFSALTKIAGFKGDRKKGLQLLWQASKFQNLNGAFSGLVLLGYYNGFVGFCDILPTSGAGAYPKQRCKALLQSFRDKYPKVSHQSHSLIEILLTVRVERSLDA
jgi:hypothetical protein